MERKSPLVLVPELFRRSGGVQRYSLRFIESLDRLLGTRVAVISTNDRPSDLPREFAENRNLIPCGEGSPWKRKWKLLHALRSSGNHPAIFSTHPNPSPLLALAKRCNGTPFLSVAHGIDAWTPSSQVRFGLRNADLLLPVSHYTAGRLGASLSHHHPPMAVLPNMVEAETFYPAEPATPWRERFGLSKTDTVILTVCRLDETETGKGYDLILEALPKLIQSHPQLHWVLGGRGNDLPRLQKKAFTLGVADRCHFPGFIEEAELPDLYRSADLFVLPSRKEGFGIVFLEAAASGLPVIAGNEDGAVDALAGGKLGALISPRSSESVRLAIEIELNRPAPDRGRQHRECIRLFGRDAFDRQLARILSEHPNLLFAE